MCSLFSEWVKPEKGKGKYFEIRDLSYVSWYLYLLQIICSYNLLGCVFGIVPQPDPNQPKPEGRQMTPVKGEPLGVICNWPPALESALQRWGTTQAKCPCLTALDVTGKPVYTLTYGEFIWVQLPFLLIALQIIMGNVFILLSSGYWSLYFSRSFKLFQWDPKLLSIAIAR